MDLRGWIELDGKQLSSGELWEILISAPHSVARFGGEFLLSWDSCTARDHFGIMPGPIPAGTITCNGRETGKVLPPVPDLPLEDAIIAAVRLRSDEGICAFSGESTRRSSPTLHSGRALQSGLPARMTLAGHGMLPKRWGSPVHTSRSPGMMCGKDCLP
jgi:hypothetical protein